ncbi:MAG: hypothetical protein CFE21_09735 [Bacteroidetes bacterium B1(2017)]|nr:MAG: hypothetical protein CFE21_09735 [Bacteroidetes bacterium B1(2017)]
MRKFLLYIALILTSVIGSAQTTATFNQHGPVKFPNNPSVQTTGMGRVSQLVYHPTDSTILFAVTASGGIFKSSNEGASWKPLSDLLPQTTCASLLINPLNPNVMYLGTGDANYNSTGIGVYKTTNAGQTWFAANTGMGNKLVSKMLFTPGDTNTIIAACSDGIYKTTNNGSTWVKKTTVTTSYRDLHFRPQSTQIVYASSNTNFYSSNNNGETWTSSVINSAITPSGIKFAICPSDTSRIYCLVWKTGATSPFGGIYQSNNNGATFTLKADTPNIMGYSSNGTSMDGQGAYNMAIIVDPNNANTIYVGTINLWKSTDAGNSYTLLSHWAFGVHADKHNFLFSPFNPNKLFICHDGGLDRTTNGGSTWITYEDGLSASEFYKMGSSSSKKDLIIGGLQDNGMDIAVNKVFSTVRGGDWGGDFASDITDSAMIYENGGLKRNLVTNVSSSINGHGGIYISHPNNGNQLFELDTFVRRTDNLKANPSSSVSWISIGNIPGSSVSGTKCGAYSKASSGTLYVYFSTQKFYVSTNANDAAPVFTQLTSFPFNASEAIKQIETCDYDSNMVYVVTNQTRLFKSSNKGLTWVQINKNLPASNFIKFAFDQQTRDSSMYLCTAFGVYYRNSTLGNWIPFSQGLPIVAQISDMEIMSDGTNNSRLYISTYGRGIWQSNLYQNTSLKPEADFTLQASTPSACPTHYMLVDHSTNNPQSRKWSISPNTGWNYINGTDSSSVRAEIQFVTPGSYSVSLMVTNSIGTSIKTNTFNYTPLAAPSCVTTTTNISGYGMGIQRFELNTLDNPSSIGVASNTDFTCKANTVLKSGTSYTAYITTGTTNGENQKIYIDYNNNGVFTDANELLGSITASGMGRRSCTFSVLATPPIANQFLRLRVVTNFGTSATPPCGLLSYGESEDYAILIDTNKLSIETVINGSSQNFGPFETDTFYSPAGKIMAVLINNTNFNYGLTTVNIDNAGAGAINYSSNTQANKKIASKTFTVSSTNTSTTGNYTIKLFYTATELSAWKAASTNTFASANILKCPLNIASGTLTNGVYGTSPIKQVFASTNDSVISATFTGSFGGFAMGANAIILPVDLLYFDVFAQKENVVLKWSTASEHNNLGFEVQRSYDLSTWASIGFVKGKGTSSVRTNYSMQDPNILLTETNPKTIYYRLKQKDQDGSSTFSEIKSIETELEDKWMVYPQPVSNILTISKTQINQSVTNEFRFELYNSEGKPVLKGSSNLLPCSLDISHLPEGIYILHLSPANGETISKKVLKGH